MFSKAVLIFAALALLALPSLAQSPAERVRVYIDSTYISRNQLIKEIGKSCPAVVVTNDRERANYSIIHEFGPFGYGNHITLFDRSGDILKTVSAKRPGNAVKQACAVLTR